MWDLSSPTQGLNPEPPEVEVEVRSLNHWTAGEVPYFQNNITFVSFFKLRITQA